jgi:hypothetical protein
MLALGVVVSGMFAVAVSASPGVSSTGSSTAFTFSSSLAQPNGTYDLKFQLFDSPTKGTAVAGPVTVGGVAVAGKKFTTKIDFGTNPFDGSARYVQMWWRPTGTTTFTKVSPRVELVAVPYALGLRLPVDESVSTGASALKISDDFGSAIEGDNTGGNAGVAGFNTGSGPGVLGNASSNGLAGLYGTAGGAVPGVWGTSNSGDGVHGSSYTGPGVYGDSTSGDGVHGEGANGAAGVSGTSGGTGPGGLFTGSGGSSPALELSNGGIKVSGAATDTATPAFVHQVTNANLCMSNDLTVLDNPYLNNNPNAMVFFQSTTTDQMVADYNAPSCPAGRWEVFRTNDNGALAWTTGLTFNVLVIDP